MKATILKKQKADANVFILLAIAIGLMYLMGPVWLKHDFLIGISIGLGLVGIFYKTYHFIKRNDENFEEDLELSANDERMKIEKIKQSNLVKSILLYELLILVTLSAFYDFSFKLGGGIMLWTYIIISVGLMLVERFRR